MRGAAEAAGGSGKANVPLVQAQRLLRHSTPTLTANIYTRLRIEDGHAAVAKIDAKRPLAKRKRGAS
jgi:hypothetical protein